MKILVTGGCGYIGGHTMVDLLDNDFEVISIDNFSRSSQVILDNIALTTGENCTNYAIDLCDLAATRKVFEAHPDIKGVIHFAAYKSVNESVNHPLRYYHNNIESLVNILTCIEEFAIPYFVFSSSCSVYGNASELPVTENTPRQQAESPYGHTKQIGEDIIQAMAKTSDKTAHIALRYFNPVGAHPKALMGEMQERPENLVPYITQTAIGKRSHLTVFGDDYDTRDGSCIRDYIHVMDIAHAHTLALQYLIAAKNEQAYEIFNLGTGNGVTVLEVIHAFEKVAQQSLNYKIGERRAGDVVTIYADNKKAKEQLGWIPKYTLEDMMSTAWQWELRMQSLSKVEA